MLENVMLQRTDRFVGRTMNWLYDHLRFVPRCKLVVVSDSLENRDEFPALEAHEMPHLAFQERLWRRLTGVDLRSRYRRVLRDLSPKLIHSHFGYVAVNDLELVRFLKVPWVVSFYGADVYQLGKLAEWQAKYRVVFEVATKILALGPEMAAALRQLGCPAEKIEVHALGVHVEALPKMPRVLRPGDSLKLLFAGTFREKKGLVYVLEAVSLARKAGIPVHLTVIGDAAGKPGDRETKAELLEKRETLGLQDHVSLYDYVAFKKLMEIALSCHVFVAPSVTASEGDAEGTPFVLQQMMATAMPCISTVHSDIPFLFGKSDGLLVPERNSQAIADRLLSYVTRPEQLTEDGIKLRREILAAFDVKSCAQRLAQIYESIK